MTERRWNFWIIYARSDDNKDEDDGDNDDDGDDDSDGDNDDDYDDDDDDDDDYDDDDGKGEMKSLINLLAWSRHTAPVYYFSRSHVDDDGDHVDDEGGHVDDDGDHVDDDDGANDDGDGQWKSPKPPDMHLVSVEQETKWQSAANQKTNPLRNIFPLCKAVWHMYTWAVCTSVHFEAKSGRLFPEVQPSSFLLLKSNKAPLNFPISLGSSYAVTLVLFYI